MAEKRITLESEKFHVAWWYRAIVWIGTWIIAIILHLLFKTCKEIVIGEKDELEAQKKAGKPNTYAIWHRSLIWAMYYFRARPGGKYKPVVIASRSKDGEWAAGMLKRFGIASPRGSSTRNGKQALEEYTDLVKKGYNGSLTPDAPKGPAQRAKIGPIITAARTGSPLMPAAQTAKPAWRLSTWDRTLVPKPFSKIYLLFDEKPIDIPANATPEQLEDCRKLLEQRLNILSYQVDCYAENPAAWDNPRDIPIPDDYFGENWDPFKFSTNYYQS